MNSNIYIRDGVKSNGEYEALARLHNLVLPEDPVTGQEMREEDACIDETKYVCRRLVAEESDSGELLGQIEFEHVPTRYHPQRFKIWIEVHPEHQRQGIGAALYHKAVEELQPHDPIAFQSVTRETRPGAIAFLKQRGFSEVSRTFESHLDLTRLEVSTAQAQLASEISITTLDVEKELNSNWLADLHALFTELGHDVPSTDAYTPIPLDQFRRRVENSHLLIEEAYFLAKRGSEYIGKSYVHRVESEPTHLIQEFTGVRRPYRRQGIALALKLKVIEYASSNGYTRIRTWNDSTNRGMLAVNEKLGFVRQPAWIKFEVDLRK